MNHKIGGEIFVLDGEWIHLLLRRQILCDNKTKERKSYVKTIFQSMYKADKYFISHTKNLRFDHTLQ